MDYMWHLVVCWQIWIHGKSDNKITWFCIDLFKPYLFEDINIFPIRKLNSSNSTAIQLTRVQQVSNEPLNLAFIPHPLHALNCACLLCLDNKIRNKNRHKTHPIKRLCCEQSTRCTTAQRDMSCSTPLSPARTLVQTVCRLAYSQSTVLASSLDGGLLLERCRWAFVCAGSLVYEFELCHILYIYIS